MKKALLLIALYCLLPLSVFAADPAPAPATEYTLLAPIPLNGFDKPSETTNAATFIPGLFRLIIGIATMLAVVMIIFGGIKYISTENFGGKSDARATITNALTGLMLAMSAWIILYTLNPKLVQFDLSTITPLEIKSAPGGTSGPSAGGGGGVMTPAEIAADSAVRQSLPAGITAAAPCLNGQTSGCVNLNGLQSVAISGLSSLQSKCQCNITITGGTEGGHSSHSSGNAVDISASPAINSVVTGNAPLKACSIYSKTGNNYLWEPTGSLCGGQFPSTGDHWHVQF